MWIQLALQAVENNTQETPCISRTTGTQPRGTGACCTPVRPPNADHTTPMPLDVYPGSLTVLVAPVVS
jgi:hypothetical protein